MGLQFQREGVHGEVMATGREGTLAGEGIQQITVHLQGEKWDWEWGGAIQPQSNPSDVLPSVKLLFLDSTTGWEASGKPMGDSSFPTTAKC